MGPAAGVTAGAAGAAGAPAATTVSITAVDGTPLTPNGLVRRRRIIETATDLAAEGGYDEVHMRDVAEQAGVALATVYRYFESKDHLLSEAVSESTAQLQARLARSPARGKTAVDQLVDVLRRASRALERRPLLTAAMVRALGSPDPGVAVASARVRDQIREIAAPILSGLEPETIEGICAVLSHVWSSSLMVWAHGQAPISSMGDELERAARLLLAGRTASG